MSKPGYLATVALLAAFHVMAAAAAALAQGPGPLTKRIPCDAFKKQDDGSWRPTRDVNVELPDGTVLTVGAAVSFTPGTPIRGLDLGAVLDKECRPG
jgi:hypothetical protein